MSFIFFLHLNQIGNQYKGTLVTFSGIGPQYVNRR
jgi:hypothetical protein